MPGIPSTPNHADHCTDRGFQYEFFCGCCGNGYMSDFKPFVMAMAGGAGSGHIGLATISHDTVFSDCVAEAKPHFRQCPACNHWVCARDCWDAARALCRDCV